MGGCGSKASEVGRNESLQASSVVEAQKSNVQQAVTLGNADEMAKLEAGHGEPSLEAEPFICERGKRKAHSQIDGTRENMWLALRRGKLTRISNRVASEESQLTVGVHDLSTGDNLPRKGVLAKEVKDVKRRLLFTRIRRGEGGHQATTDVKASMNGRKKRVIRLSSFGSMKEFSLQGRRHRPVGTRERNAKANGTTLGRTLVASITLLEEANLKGGRNKIQELAALELHDLLLAADQRT